MEIRKATIADAEKIAQVHTASWQTTYCNILPAAFLASIPNAKKAESFENEIKRQEKELYCVHLGAELIGMFILQYHADRCEIVALYLLAKYQHRSFGKKIMHFIKNSCKKQHLSEISLWVLEENLSAISFYQKEGFSASSLCKSLIIADIPIEEIELQFLIQ